MNIQSNPEKPVNEVISEKKRAIFESTLHLVREHGFHGTPMSLVAKTAGVAAGTIYHYFNGKDELICDLYHYNRRRLIQVVNDAVTEGGSTRTKFYRICRSLFTFYSNHPNVLVFFEQFVNSPYREQVQSKNVDSRPLDEFLSDAVRQGVLKNYPTRIFMSTMMCTVVSAAKFSLSEEMRPTPEEFEQTIDILWDGFRNQEYSRSNPPTSEG